MKLPKIDTSDWYNDPLFIKLNDSLVAVVDDLSKKTEEEKEEWLKMMKEITNKKFVGHGDSI